MQATPYLLKTDSAVNFFAMTSLSKTEIDQGLDNQIIEPYRHAAVPCSGTSFSPAALRKCSSVTCK